jgi:histone H3/H4
MSAKPAESVAKRQPPAQSAGLKISPARVRRFLDGGNLNAAVAALQAIYKKDIDAYNNAEALLKEGKRKEKYEEKVKKEDGSEDFSIKTREVELTEAEKLALQTEMSNIQPHLAEFIEKSTAYSRERVRVSTDAPVALAIVCEALTQQLGTHAMESTLKAKKKIVQIDHIHSAGVESLSLYPLVKSLPSFVANAGRVAAEAKRVELEAAVADAKEKALKEFKKLHKIPNAKKAEKPATQPAPAAPVEEPVAQPHVDDVVTTNTGFQHYVHQVCKVCTSKKEYEKIRFSKEFKQYLSDLIVEFINRLSSLVHLTTDSMKIKTVNKSSIMKTIEFIMIDGHKPEEHIALGTAKVPDPAALKAEQQKKEDAKKLGQTYKIDHKTLPEVDGLSAVRSIKFPTCGFDALNSEVDDKLALFEKSGEKLDEEPEVRPAVTV